MKSTRFHRAVLLEIEATARWYSRQRPGLGDEYLQDLDAAMARIEGDAVSSPVPEDPRSRRIFLERFPYAVVFLETSDDTRFVLAVTHLRRAPGYWLARIEDDEE